MISSAQTVYNEVEKVRKHEEWEVEYMTLYLRDMEKREEGREEGIAIGLFALINSLKAYITDPEELYQAIIKNDAYKDTPREEVLKYLK